MPAGTFEEFLVSQTPQVDLWSFLLALLLSAILSYILSKVYVRYGTSLSNRQKFAGNFVLITTTTCLIITIVKSSLALSLGLVGALSIVRFRAAIKEPEELAFLFLTIAMGLGFGANQFGVTILAFVVIVILIIINSLRRAKQDNQNMYLSISGSRTKQVDTETITAILAKHCDTIHLKRSDETEKNIELTYFVTFTTVKQLTQITKEIKKLSKTLHVTYLDQQGIIA